ncbi:MAG: hypothetical protein WC924_02785 [Candidatus Gracilibacteria bacterium]
MQRIKRRRTLETSRALGFCMDFDEYCYAECKEGEAQHLPDGQVEKTLVDQEVFEEFHDEAHGKIEHKKETEKEAGLGGFIFFEPQGEEDGEKHHAHAEFVKLRGMSGEVVHSIEYHTPRCVRFAAQ